MPPPSAASIPDAGARRVLITGISRFWGTRLALALEGDPAIALVVGMDTREPAVAFARTRFVRADIRHTLIGRLIREHAIDTVVDTHLLTDTSIVGARLAHETNVMGMLNLLAGCGGADSPVRRVVVKSSTVFYGTNSLGPSVFGEESRPPAAPGDPFIADVVEIEEMSREFGVRNPEAAVTVLRFANVLGPRLQTPLSRYLGRRAVPTVFGFDPLLQFLAEDDAVEALRLATLGAAPGTYNVAGPGCMPLSQVLLRAGRINLPILAPLPGAVTAPLLGLMGAPLSGHLVDLLRDGRVVDGSRLAGATGFAPRSTCETVQAWAGHVRSEAVAGTRAHEPYRPEETEVGAIREAVAGGVSPN